MNWGVYIVKCSDGTYYTGATNNLDKRLLTHNKGKGAKYTRSRLPVTLMAFTGGLTKSQALRLEHQVKKRPRTQKIAYLKAYNNDLTPRRIYMGYTESVREFSSACHDDLPESPVEMTDEKIAFITKMVADEMEELSIAKTITEQADALVDAIYYICDTAARHGMNLDPLFEIVHGANMKKVVDGKVIRREDGKIMKPPCWEDPGPKLDVEVARQEKEGAFISPFVRSLRDMD